MNKLNKEDIEFLKDLRFNDIIKAVIGTEY